jgi:uncharacterized membrane protein
MIGYIKFKCILLIDDSLAFDGQFGVFVVLLPDRFISTFSELPFLISLFGLPVLENEM